MEGRAGCVAAGSVPAEYVQEDVRRTLREPRPDGAVGTDLDGGGSGNRLPCQVLLRRRRARDAGRGETYVPGGGRVVHLDVRDDRGNATAGNAAPTEHRDGPITLSCSQRRRSGAVDACGRERVVRRTAGHRSRLVIAVEVDEHPGRTCGDVQADR